MAEETFRNYRSFAGCDALVYTIFPNAKPIVLGQLTTISYSIFRDKKPVPLMNRISVAGFTKGPRFVAGTMIFTLLNRHWVNEVRDQITWLQPYGYMKADEIPPFDIMVILANEYGASGQFYIYGTQIHDEGQVLSIEDIFTENQFSFMAEDIDTIDGPWGPRDKTNDPPIGVSGVTVYGTHTDIDRNKPMLEKFGYRFVYVDTPGFDWSKHVINKYDIILGGVDTTNGVNAANNPNNAGRLWGKDRYETSEASKMFMDFLYNDEDNILAHINYVKKGVTINVYGTGNDLKNAKDNLEGPYNFIDVGSMSHAEKLAIKFQPTDIVLGGPMEIEIPADCNLNGALRIGGFNSESTQAQIQQYNNMVTSQTGVLKITQPIDGVVNGEQGTSVRSGAGPQYQIIATIPFGDKVKVYEIYPNWVKVKTQAGVDGFIDRIQVVLDKGD